MYNFRLLIFLFLTYKLFICYGYSSLSDVCVVNIFLPVCGLPFHLQNGICWWMEVLSWNEVPITKSFSACSLGRSLLPAVFSLVSVGDRVSGPRCLLHPSCGAFLLLIPAQFTWCRFTRWWLSLLLLFEETPLLLAHTWIFSCNHRTWRLQSIPYRSQQPALPPWFPQQFSFPSDTHARGVITNERQLVHLPLSGPSWLGLPGVTGDLDTSFRSSQQGNASQDLSSPGLQYKVTTHPRNKILYCRFNIYTPNSGTPNLGPTQSSQRAMTILLYISKVLPELSHFLLQRDSSHRSGVIRKCNEIITKVHTPGCENLHLHFYKPPLKTWHFKKLWIEPNYSCIAIFVIFVINTNHRYLHII